MHRGVSQLVCVVGILAVAVALVPATASSSSHAKRSSLSQLEQGVLAQLNQVRVAHGLVPLKLNVRLTAAADQHSREMVVKGYFAHESADGGSFWKRVQRFYGSSSFGYWSVGENLLWSSPDVDPEKALELWMASPKHRENILTARWREIGISAVHVADAPGTYGGLEVTAITTDFGVRR